MTKVLIVEDETSIREMYRTKLELAGFDIETAENGQVGLEKAGSFKPNVILLDLRMPIMSGDAMLAKLRETNWGADMRVVILTNISRDEAPHTLRFLGVDRYIVKAHSTPSQVAEIVAEVLQS